MATDFDSGKKSAVLFYMCANSLLGELRINRMNRWIYGQGDQVSFLPKTEFVNLNLWPPDRQKTPARLQWTRELGTAIPIQQLHSSFHAPSDPRNSFGFLWWALSEFLISTKLINFLNFCGNEEVEVVKCIEKNSRSTQHVDNKWTMPIYRRPAQESSKVSECWCWMMPLWTREWPVGVEIYNSFVVLHLLLLLCPMMTVIPTLFTYPHTTGET